MSYPGSSDLDQKVQQRILTAFGESVRLFREGHPEECRTILRSILEVDARFTPAQRLEDAIIRGAQVDLAQLLGELAASSPRADETLTRAREAMAKRDFQGALTHAQSILRELPGHLEARSLARDAQARMRAAAEVEAHLGHAEAALGAGMVAEATGFVKLALAADPTHPKLEGLSRRLQEAEISPSPEPEPAFEFETFQPSEEAGAGDPTPSAIAAPQPPPHAAVPPAPARPAPLPPPAAPPRAPAMAPAVPPPAAAPRAAAPQAAPPPAAPVPPPPPPPLFAFDEASHLVDFGGEDAVAFQTSGEPATGEETSEKIAALLDQGQHAFDQGDYQTAIDTWSRIYLVDSQNSEAERRIEQARRRREEIERLAEHRYYEAREAFDQGRRDEARKLCQEVLELLPQHLEAHDLLARLETPAAPPPPPSESAGDVDLFKDDFVPAKLTATPEPFSAFPSAPLPVVQRVVKPSRRAGPPARRLPVSIPLLAGIGGMVLLLVVVGLVLRGTVFSGGAREVARTIAEADQLAAAGKLEAAVSLLQNTEAEGEAANQLNQKALEYARRLKAAKKAALPTAVTEARGALAAGRRVKAWQAVHEGLHRIPGDPELQQIEREIADYSAALGPLAAAVSEKKWDVVRTAAAQVLERHPDDVEVEGLWRVGTFNAAVAALRVYQVATAHSLLRELATKGDDPEVKRLLEMSTSYLSRQVDPRYQIFIGTIELRKPE